MAAEATPQGPPAPPTHVSVGGKEFPSLADGEYDVIVLGTGLKEVLLAGMLAMQKQKRVRFARTLKIFRRGSCGVGVSRAP